MHESKLCDAFPHVLHTVLRAHLLLAFAAEHPLPTDSYRRMWVTGKPQREDPALTDIA